MHTPDHPRRCALDLAGNASVRTLGIIGVFKFLTTVLAVDKEIGSSCLQL